jgi:hypothetical protein
MVEGEATIYQGMYFVENRGTLNVPLVAADPTNGRIDLIVARVRDEQYTGGISGSPWEIVAIAGAPAPSPAPPARPSNSIALAQVAVAAAATVINTGNITDLRPGQAAMFGGVVLVANATARAALTDLFPGVLARELDTFRTFMWDGTKWVYQYGGNSLITVTNPGPWNMPWGWIGEVSLAGNAAVTPAFSTSGTLTFAWPKNRRLRLSASFGVYTAALATAITGRVAAGATQVGIGFSFSTGAAYSDRAYAFVEGTYVTPDNASRSYTAGFNASSTAPYLANTTGTNLLVVEDIGPSSATP